MSAPKDVWSDPATAPAAAPPSYNQALADPSVSSSPVVVASDPNQELIRALQTTIETQRITIVQLRQQIDEFKQQRDEEKNHISNESRCQQQGCESKAMHRCEYSDCCTSQCDVRLCDAHVYRMTQGLETIECCRKHKANDCVIS